MTLKKLISSRTFAAMKGTSVEELLDECVFIEDIEYIDDYSHPMPDFMKSKGPSYRLLRGCLIVDEVTFVPLPPLPLKDHCLTLCGDMISSSDSTVVTKVKMRLVSHLITIDNQLGLWVQDHAETWYRVSSPYHSLYESEFSRFASSINGILESNSPEMLMDMVDAALVDANGQEVQLISTMPVMKKGGKLKEIIDRKGDCYLMGTKILNDEMTALLWISIVDYQYYVSRSSSGAIIEEIRGKCKCSSWFSLPLAPSILSPSRQDGIKQALKFVHSDVFVSKSDVLDEQFFVVNDFSITSASGQSVAIHELGTLGPDGAMITGYLTGLLFSTAKSYPVIRIHVLVDDYFMDMKGATSPYATFYVKSAVDDVWYKLVEPALLYSKFPKDLQYFVELYNWPSEEANPWRHLTEFKVYRKVKSSTSLCRIMDVIEFPVESAQHSYLAIGRLNPPPEHATICRLKVRIHPLRYSVDFGLAIGDSNAGLWLCDGMEIWYKIIPPAMAEYDSIVQKDLLLCENIIALHNALIRVDTELCDQDERTLLCYTNLTLDEVYERTKTHTPFDRAIIRSNRASVESNLSNAIDFKRSPRFRNSLKVVLPVPVLVTLSPVPPMAPAAKVESATKKDVPVAKAASTKRSIADVESSSSKPTKPPVARALFSNTKAGEVPSTTTGSAPTSTAPATATSTSSIEGAAKAPIAKKPRLESETTKPALNPIPKKTLSLPTPTAVAGRPGNAASSAPPTAPPPPPAPKISRQDVFGSFLQNNTSGLAAVPLGAALKPLLKLPPPGGSTQVHPRDHRMPPSGSQANMFIQGNALSQQVPKISSSGSEAASQLSQPSSNSAATTSAASSTGHYSLGNTSSATDSRPGSELCWYCKGLKKSNKCHNERHIDGQHLFIHAAKDSSVSAINPSAFGLCPHCSTTRKKVSCPFQEHRDGHQMPSAAPPPAPSYSIQQLQLLQPTASAASVFDRKSYDSNNKDKHKKSFININEDEAERKHYYVHHSPAPGNNNSSRPQVPPLNLVDVPRNDQSGRKPQVRSEVWRERVTKANSDWQDRYGNISVAVVANNNTSKSGQKTKNLAWRDESGPSDGNNRLRKIHEFTHHPDEFTTTGQVIVPFLGPNGSPVSPMSDCDL